MRNAYGRNSRERSRSCTARLASAPCPGWMRTRPARFQPCCPLQRLMLHVVPQLHAVAIRSRVVTRLTRAVRALGELVPAALVVVDGMYETAEIVAVITMARDALVHVAVRLGSALLSIVACLYSIFDHRIHISMARNCTLSCPRRGSTCCAKWSSLLHPMGHSYSVGVTLNQLPVRISDDLGRDTCRNSRRCCSLPGSCPTCRSRRRIGPQRRFSTIYRLFVVRGY